MNSAHSVKLIEGKCIGCTDCIKRCPTEAIRVRNGKAMIVSEKCIDCGLCIKVCAHSAKKAVTQPMSVINDYKYKVAIPAPTIYAQFKNVYDVNAILTGIKRLGFDEVFEVSRAAEIVTEATREMLSSGKLKKPVISSACPAVMRLIQMRFPDLIENILPIMAPVEVAAMAAKDFLASKGIAREDIGVFFISPCAAKSTYMKYPLGIEKSEIDAVISIQDIYMKLRSILSKLDNVEALAESGGEGVGWALTGGESRNINIENAIAVDGVENVINILEEVENGQLTDVDFIEGLACTGGCVGGPLTVVNGFVAKNHLRRVERGMKDAAKRGSDTPWPAFVEHGSGHMSFTKELERISALQLDEDMEAALKKMEDIEEIYSHLPMIDCGSCGAPTCYALSRDIVQGDANIEDCLFMLRKKVRDLAESMLDLSSKLPQTILSKENR